MTRLLAYSMNFVPPVTPEARLEHVPRRRPPVVPASSAETPAADPRQDRPELLPPATRARVPMDARAYDCHQRGCSSPLPVEERILCTSCPYGHRHWDAA